MVINDKAVLRNMKEAYKNKGYTVAVEDGLMYIDAGYWLIRLQTDEVSNEILSLITLHTRKTLAEGEAYKVIKGDNGPIAQRILAEAALSTARTMAELLCERGPHDQVRMVKTNIRYDGCGVWQNAALLGVMLIDPRYEAMIADKKGVTHLGDGIYAEGNISAAWVMKVDKKSDSAQLKHLSGFRWMLA